MKSKMFNLVLFTVFCGVVLVGLFYLDPLKYVGKGEHHQFVIDGKPTLYAFYDEKDSQSNAYKQTTQIVSELGRKYGEEIVIFPVSREFAETPLYKESFRIEKFPTLVVVNDRGYIVSFYDGLIDGEDIKYDMSVLLGK